MPLCGRIRKKKWYELCIYLFLFFLFLLFSPPPFFPSSFIVVPDLFNKILHCNKIVVLCILVSLLEGTFFLKNGQYHVMDLNQICSWVQIAKRVFKALSLSFAAPEMDQAAAWPQNINWINYLYWTLYGVISLPKSQQFGKTDRSSGTVMNCKTGLRQEIGQQISPAWKDECEKFV